MDNYDIEELMQHGVGAAEIKKLRESGICSVKAVLMRTTKELSEVKGLSEAKIDKIITAAKKCIFGESETGELVSSREREVYRTNLFKLRTGLEEIDNLLGGGIESESLTELFGESKSGKSQFCHWCCVKAAAEGYRSVYIDTEGSFRPERIR